MTNQTLPDQSAIPTEVHDVLGGLAGLNGKHAPVHVLEKLQVGASNGDFIDYWAAYKSTSSLSPLEQEMIILRLALRLDAPYVWAHHIEPLNLAGGESWHRERVIEPASGRIETRLDALLALVDNIVDDARVSQAVLAASPLAQNEVIDAIQLVSQYYLFATTTKSFDLAVEFDEDPADRLPSTATTSVGGQ